MKNVLFFARGAAEAIVHVDMATNREWRRTTGMANMSPYPNQQFLSRPMKVRYAGCCAATRRQVRRVTAKIYEAMLLCRQAAADAPGTNVMLVGSYATTMNGEGN